MTRTEKPPRRPAADATRYLVVDRRFPIPVTVLLDLDPRAEPGFPGFPVREVELEPDDQPDGQFLGAGDAIGRDPRRLDRFRAFPSDGAVARAGYILIEPRYVGPSWPAYVLAFKPDGGKPHRR